MSIMQKIITLNIVFASSDAIICTFILNYNKCEIMIAIKKIEACLAFLVAVGKRKGCNKKHISLNGWKEILQKHFLSPTATNSKRIVEKVSIVLLLSIIF